MVLLVDPAREDVAFPVEHRKGVKSFSSLSSPGPRFCAQNDEIFTSQDTGRGGYENPWQLSPVTRKSATQV